MLNDPGMTFLSVLSFRDDNEWCQKHFYGIPLNGMTDLPDYLVCSASLLIAWEKHILLNNVWNYDFLELLCECRNAEDVECFAKFHHFSLLSFEIFPLQEIAFIRTISDGYGRLYS